MTHYHLDRKELERLEQGELTQAETTQVSRHLIDCAECRRALQGLASEPADQLMALIHALTSQDSGGTTAEFAEASRSPDVAPWPEAQAPVARSSEMVDPQTLLDSLRPLERRERQARLQEDPTLCSMALVELLLAESWEARTRAPRAAEDWAQVALTALDLLDDDFSDLPRLRDLQARAWIYRANSLRIRFLMPEARAAFERAEELLAEGSREPRLRALWLELKGVYLRESQNYDEALRTLDQAIAIHRWAENPEGECSCLIYKANVFEMQGELEPALAILEQAANLLDPSFDPYIAVCVQQVRAVYLMQAGKPREAEKLLPEVRRFVHQAGMRISQLRVFWLEGQIATKLGDLERAEEILRQVRADFLKERMGYEAGQVSLELAALYLEQGRTAETRQLALDMVQVFDRLDIQREAFTALVMFQKAVLSEQATVEMVREIHQVLGRLKARPARRPEKPS